MLNDTPRCGDGRGTAISRLIAIYYIKEMVKLQADPLFLAVAEAGNFSGGGRAVLWHSQPTNRQIAALEEELGVTLFVRRREACVSHARKASCSGAGGGDGCGAGQPARRTTPELARGRGRRAAPAAFELRC